jgi:thiol:disulfide interchange protein
MPRLLFLACLCSSLSAIASPVRQLHSEAELIPERASIAPGATLTVALRLQMEDHWHVYWKNPGDAGMPTSIAWTLPPGYVAGPIQWPAPQRIDTGPLASFGYEREVALLTDIRAPKDATLGTQVPIRAKADWLVCREICIPASAEFELSMPVASQSGSPDPHSAPIFAAARSRTPAPLGNWQASAYRQGNDFVIRLFSHGNAPAIDELEFFPDREGVIANAGQQKLTRSANGYDLRIAVATQPIGDASTLKGVLVAAPGLGGAHAVEIALNVERGATPESAPITARVGLATAIALAFGGGLLLNLMPCVFPVLAIKVLGVLQQAHGDPRKLRVHGLLFALGVMLSFWAIAGLLLGLRAQGTSLGWGYQLQSPPIVAGLAVLFFVLGLNLSGVYQIGLGLQARAGSIRASGVHADALLTGLLATIVASPCTAPFMGAAVGFALVQPALHAMLVFTGLAAGMALPYVMLCFLPRLILRLPKPGQWMEILKQLLAFPLYATVVWLLWVLGQQVGGDGVARLLAGLVTIAAGLWALGRRPHSRGAVRVSVTVVAIALILGGVALGWPHGDPERTSSQRAQGQWQPWSEAAVQAALSQGRPVFVDFTAAWCVTCQVNKRLVLHSDAVDRRFTELGVVRLRADWTNRDSAITAELARLKRSGVPLYAVYTPARREPVLLPEVLTRATVLDAINTLNPRQARGPG